MNAIILDESGREFISPCSKIGDMTPAGDKQNLQILDEFKGPSGFPSFSSLDPCILFPAIPSTRSMSLIKTYIVYDPLVIQNFPYKLFTSYFNQ